MTAQEFIDKELYNGVEPSGYFHGEAWDFFESKMIQFAKLHVEEALKQAEGEAPLIYSHGILNCYKDKIK